MDLIERLRPRWRHSDPTVRAAAVREMGPEDAERLAAIARSDPDAGVRRIAIRKLDTAELLESLAASETDGALRDLAAERVREIRVAIASSGRPLAECEAALARLGDDRSLASVAMAGTHECIRHAALTRTSADRVLREIVRSASDPAIRRAALDRIRDPAVLRSIATSDCPAELALRALEQIDDADALRAIAESRTAAKSVRQRARTLVPSGSDERPPVGFKEGRARQLALCVAVGTLGAETDVMRAAEQVREAQREWRELARDVEPREDVAERFMTACGAVLEDAASLARRWAAADHTRTALEESLAAGQALCARVEALDGADALRDLDEARAAWRRLSPVPSEQGVALSRRFTLACEGCVARHQRWLAHQARRAALEAVVGEAETLADSSPPPAARTWKALEGRWASLEPARESSHESALLARRFASAGEHLQRRWEEAEQRQGALRQENLTRLARLCARLEQMAQAEALSPSAARRELQKAEAALGALGPLPASERRAAWTERLSGARAQLLRRAAQQEETEQWRRWANVGAQEEIIRRVEALLEANDLGEGVRQLGRLGEDWASVASATPERSQTLWERFRTARNQLRRRCDAYLADNLERKRALCAQVAGLGDSTAWSETAELIKRLQAEWKQVGPVPAKHAAAPWQQFREACDRFFARRKEHFDRLDDERRESAQRKTALCEQAEALADSTDWEATATAIRQLQGEWKRSGPLRRAQGEALWQRFRTACDRFFERRSRREELAREAALHSAQVICEELEALVTALRGEEGPAPERIGERIDQAWVQWLRLDLAMLDDARALNERLRAACEQIAAARPESLRGTRLDPDVTRKRREKLCARMEELRGCEAPCALSLQEMALALRERLAANTIAGGSAPRPSRPQDAAREVERLSASWAYLGPALDEHARALTERFERARAGVRAVSK